MTAKMTDKEILFKCYRYASDEKMLDYIMPEVRTASLIAWKTAEDHFIPQIQQLQSEIERLKELLLQHEGISEALTQCTYENADLTAKHEKLVKWLEENDAHFLETNEVLEKLNGEEVKQ